MYVPPRAAGSGLFQFARLIFEILVKNKYKIFHKNTQHYFTNFSGMLAEFEIMISHKTFQKQPSKLKKRLLSAFGQTGYRVTRSRGVTTTNH